MLVVTTVTCPADDVTVSVAADNIKAFAIVSVDQSSAVNDCQGSSIVSWLSASDWLGCWLFDWLDGNFFVGFKALADAALLH